MSQLSHSGDHPQFLHSRLGLYPRLFWKFLRLGLLAWGGAVAHVGMIKQEFVEDEKWIPPAQFNRVLAVYQVLPGPEATELCVYFGMLSRGMLGGKEFAEMKRGVYLICAARGGVIRKLQTELVFDANASFDVQEVALPSATGRRLKQLDRLHGHVLDARLSTQIGGTVELVLHVAALEEAEHGETGRSQRGEAGCVPHVGIACCLVFRAEVTTIATGAGTAFFVKRCRWDEELTTATHEQIQPLPEPPKEGPVKAVISAKRSIRRTWCGLPTLPLASSR